MALPDRADVREIIGRIRPGSPFGWKGGQPNDASLVRWRDRANPEPTEAEYLAELAVIDREKVKKTRTRIKQRGRSDTLVGKDPNRFNNNEQKNALEELLFHVGALDENGLVLPIREWGRGTLDRMDFPDA